MPLVLQMEAVECGAACLAMILAHYGRWAPLEELREACGVSRDGSNALALVRAARRYGLEANGCKLDLTAFAALDGPTVVFWNFNHYIIVQRRHGDRFYVNDPALGRRVLTLAEFSEGFTGVAVMLRPGPDFKPGGQRPQVLMPLIKELKNVKAGFGFIVLATLLLVVPGILVPVFTKVFVDRILVARQVEWTRPLLALFALTALLSTGLTLLQQHLLLKLELRLTIAAGSRMMWRLFALPLTYFSHRAAADVAGRVQANSRVAQVVAGLLPANLVGLLTLGFYAALMLSYDAGLAAVVILLTAANLLVFRWILGATRNGSQVLAQNNAQQLAAVVTGLGAIETVKAAGLESRLLGRWLGHQGRFIALSQQLGQSTQLLGLLPGFLSTLVSLVVLAWGSLLVLGGRLSVGDLIAFQALTASFAGPVSSLVGLGGQLQTAAADLRRIDDVLRYKLPLPCPAIRTVDGGKLSGNLEFRHVSFGYNRQLPPLIEDFNLEVRPGRRVALVGLSGSGKSTLLRLLNGQHQPWSGEILLDGIPISQIEPDVLSGSVAYVEQEIVLFGGSVLDNVRLWDPTIGSDTVVRALADACLLPTVQLRPGGLLATVAEGGRNFSGGERQRLEIARALAKDPTLLLLDEATAALDPAVEKQLDNNLRRRGCACLISAHRLSTIRDCDEIVVLKRGHVVQRGTHADLNTGGEYARLAAAQ